MARLKEAQAPEAPVMKTEPKDRPDVRQTEPAAPNTRQRKPKKPDVEQDVPEMPIPGNLENMATDLDGIVRIANGGTGASTATGALKNLGIQCGTSEAQNVGSTSVEDRIVTFPIPYAADTVPVVLVSFTSGSSAANFGRLNIAVASATNTEFTCRIFNSDSSTRVPGFNWIAIGTPA